MTFGISTNWLCAERIGRAPGERGMFTAAKNETPWNDAAKRPTMDSLKSMCVLYKINRFSTVYARVGQGENPKDWRKL